MLSKRLFRSTRILPEETLESESELSGSGSKLIKGIALAVILVSVLSSLISYNLVLSKEKDIQKLHAETFNTQMDNIDVKNQVDFTQSLYNVHDKAKSISYLQKPKKIIEVDLNKKNMEIDTDKNYEDLTGRIVAGY